MISTEAEQTPDVQACAITLLDHHPDAAIFFLPTWKEIEGDKWIIAFQAGYSTKMAASAFQITAGQAVSHQNGESNPNECSFRGLLFDQLLQTFRQKNKIEQHYYDAPTKRGYTLLCTPVNEGVLVLIREVSGDVRILQQAELDSSLFQAAGTGLVVLEAVCNENGTITDFLIRQANPMFARLIEKSGMHTGQSYRFLLPEVPEMFRLKSRVLETGDNITYHYNYTENGKNKWFSITLSKWGHNYLIASFADITEIKKQEAVQLQQYDSRIQIIFDTAHAGMYTLIPVRNEEGAIYDFRFGLVSQKVASYLGLQAEDLVGSLGSVYFPAYKTNGLFDRYVETMNTGNPATFDLHYTDGYDNYFTINVVKMGDELFATFTDHSDLKRLQRELERSIVDLKRSNASLEQFAHASSHDLQEPLRKITRHATKLEEQHADELTDEAFEHVERIKTASKRMQRLIQDLLVFAEVGANQAGSEEVSLNTLLQEVTNDLEVAIAERDAVIVFDDLGTVKGDSLHLQQLFQNLLSNALKYSRHEVAPHVSITSKKVGGTESGFELGEYEAEKDYWLIQVKDNGQGFDPEQARQIFKIFQRLPQHRNECTGTGIGLAIVQRVVENHKGYIRAEGVSGQGATFTILLPA